MITLLGLYILNMGSKPTSKHATQQYVSYSYSYRFTNIKINALQEC